jgi:hypothetical protein
MGGSFKTDNREIGYTDGDGMELAQEHVRWQILVLVMLKRGVILPEN